MKVSGFTLIKNGVTHDYPFEESIRSLLPLVDEMIVNVGFSEDDTLPRVQKLREEYPQKIKIIESQWPLFNSDKMKGGQILSEQTNIALKECTGDWCIYLQTDEILHEADYSAIRKSLKAFASDSEVEGLLFDYHHFYGSFEIVQNTRSAYRREVRIVKRSSGAQSVGDAQSFRKKDGTKLHVARVDARIYHYGWVRKPEAMKAKTVFMDSLYHGADSGGAGVPATGNNFEYKRFWGLEPFAGSHPAVMSHRIIEKGWHWDFDSAPFQWIVSDLKKIVLDLYERLTGVRLFEYQSYILLNKEISPDPEFPAATLVLATYEMPRHLKMVCESLLRQTTKDFEVLICDDGSGSETKKVIQEFQNRAKAHSNLKVEHLWQENRGFRKSKILNQAIRASRGKVLIFLDGDCVPHRAFIQDHIDWARPGYFLAGRRVELGKDLSATLTEKDVSNGVFDYPSWKLFRSIFRGDSEHPQRTFRVKNPLLRWVLKMDRVSDLKGCNYSVYRTDMLAINGYDETYEGYGREDTDVEVRLMNLGLKRRSVKGLALQFHVWHERRAFTPANDQRLEEVKRHRIVLAEKGIRLLSDAWGVNSKQE
jgi:glycosyltransferase involved in cell wall biosynthesis